MNKIQFRVLYRDFLLRLIDLDILSSHAQGGASALFGQFATLLVFVSLWVYTTMALGYAYAKMPAQGLLLFGWTAEHSLISTTMLVVGLFAVLSWDSTFPDRRDVLVLAPLPVRASTMFLAKVAAVSTGLSVTVLALHLFAGLAWPLALNRSIAAQATISYTTDPAIPPVDAADLHSVLDRDLAGAQVFKTGLLAPGTNAGVAIGVYQRGVRRVFAYGAARADSLFEIGSISKTFTGLVLARMVQEGKVRYDEPVRMLLPEGTVTQPRGGEITLLDLATQHSGLPRMPGNFHPADKTNPYADYHAEDLYAYLARRGVAKPAKTDFLYSNLGFGLLGHALANRAGTSYEGLLKEEVTGPLGMRDTVIALSPEQRRRFIQGHDGEHRPVHAWDLDALAGAGAIRSTAGDMLTYLQDQLHPEGTLAEAVRDSHRLRAGVVPGASIALAWFYNFPIPGSLCYWHGGATAGYTSDAFFNLADDSAAVVLVNTGPNGDGFADWLSEHIRQRLAGEPAVSLATVSVPASGGLWRLMRGFAAYWITMLAAGGFMFCCVLGLQGIVCQLLPRRIFLRVSSFLQLEVFCLLVSVYFLQPTATGPLTLIEAQGSGILAWSPTFWFLGLFQQLNGSPALASLAWRAWLGMAVAGCGTAIAYLLSYFRTLRKIVEEPDIAPGIRGANWLPRLGDGLQTAIVQFSVRTLLRSRQHRLILAFYLGLGFAAAIFLLRTRAPIENSPQEISAAFQAATLTDAWREVSVPLLACSILMLGLWVAGIRVVFSLPLDLRANWIFRVTPTPAGRVSLAARRRALFVLALVPFLSLAAVLFFSIWSWRPAAGHLALLGILGLILVELCLGGRQKIPFTCSWLPGKSGFHITALLSMTLVFVIVTKGAEFELHALEDRETYACVVAVLAAVAIFTRWRTMLRTSSDEDPIEFEEAPSWQVLTLGLPKDGGLQVEPGCTT